MLDIKGVVPLYIGPRLKSDVDMWGVVRKSVLSGLAAYTEIDHGPLASVEDVDGIARHAWPDAAMFETASSVHPQ